MRPQRVQVAGVRITSLVTTEGTCGNQHADRKYAETGEITKAAAQPDEDRVLQSERQLTSKANGKGVEDQATMRRNRILSVESLSQNKLLP